MKPTSFPLIVSGKMKVITLKPVFDTQGSPSFKGVGLFAMGYEENGQRVLFGNLLRVNLQHGSNWAKVSLVDEKEASKLFKGHNLKNSIDIMNKDEI